MLFRVLNDSLTIFYLNNKYYEIELTYDHYTYTKEGAHLPIYDRAIIRHDDEREKMILDIDFTNDDCHNFLDSLYTFKICANLSIEEDIYRRYHNWLKNKWVDSRASVATRVMYIIVLSILKKLAGVRY